MYPRRALQSPSNKCGVFLLCSVLLPFSFVVSIQVADFGGFSGGEAAEFEHTRALTPSFSIQVVAVFHLECLTLFNLENYDIRGNRDLNYIHLILPMPIIITHYGLNESFKLGQLFKLNVTSAGVTPIKSNID